MVVTKGAQLDQFDYNRDLFMNFLLRLYRNQSILDDLWKYVCALLGILAAILVSWSRYFIDLFLLMYC